MNGFLSELKRRNVIRMAGLYLVGAWLITQVAGTVLPMFGAPGWIARSIVVLLAIGFIPAMFFAWIFELTPDGLKRDSEIPEEQSIAPQTARKMERLIIALFAVALIFFGFDKFVLAPKREAALVTETTQSVKAVAKTEAQAKALDNSIAVLPFVNMSEDKDNQYFSDGISEELLNVLVRVDDLSVASRTSSFAYRDKKMASSAIAKELNVGHILEGSVRKSGNKVRITAQLIDAGKDRHIWSETYDRELTDIFAIQDEIANAIVVALRGSLADDKGQAVVNVKVDTTNMKAYEIYLKARELFIARSDLAESVRLFEQVVEMDPNFARGWEGLAAVTAVAPSWGLLDRDYLAVSTAAAERALALDSSLSMPWAVKAYNMQNRWPIDFGTQLSLFNKAIVVDPKNATAFHWRAIVWIRLGFFERAIADFNRAIELEPGYLNAIRFKAVTLLFSGKVDEAIRLFDSGITKGFVSSMSENFIAALFAHNRKTEALLLMDVGNLAPELREAFIARLETPQPMRLEASALKTAREMAERHVGDPQFRPGSGAFTGTHLYLWLGDYESAGNTDDSITTTIVAWDTYPADWRNSSGMKHKLERMGVVAYWRAKGFPPQCRAVGKDDFTCDQPRLLP